MILIKMYTKANVITVATDKLYKTKVRILLHCTVSGIFLL